MGNVLGILTGADESFSINAWPLEASQVVSGANDITIDTDANNTGCWCVEVKWLEVRAKLDFDVIDHTPVADDRNRDFHADRVDLSATFSRLPDTTTVTADTFKVEYRDQNGNWQQILGTVGISFPIEENRVVFEPDNDLIDAIRYRVTIRGGPNGVKSEDGAEMGEDTVWTFWDSPLI